MIPRAFAPPQPVVAPVRARAAPIAHIAHRRAPVKCGCLGTPTTMIQPLSCPTRKTSLIVPRAPTPT
jgi:hypothetical protein